MNKGGGVAYVILVFEGESCCFVIREVGRLMGELYTNDLGEEDVRVFRRVEIECSKSE